MAEAVVEDRATNITRYFCHMCNVEISIRTTELTCPICHGGFVEELPTARPNLNANTDSNASVGTNSSAASGAENASSNTQGRNRLSGWSDLATLLLSRNGSEIEFTLGDDNNRRVSLDGGARTRGGVPRATNSDNSQPRRTAVIGISGLRPQSMDRIDPVLIDFLNTIRMTQIDGPLGNSQFFFLGNPGDYAWGREGIDTIVTQLLNQMETSGPPPLSKEKIDEIPLSQVNEEEVQKKVQCCVCWDDFKLDETVRRLPCSHIYHENCIIPWLKLHNTCPICRKSLADENATEQNSWDRAQRTSNGRTITVTRGGSTTLSGENDSSVNTNTAGASGGASTSQGNVFGFDDGNQNLDMDLD